MDQQSYLSLGDMLTFIGLIVAVYQLIKPRYLLIWKLSSPVLRVLAIVLLAMGYLMPLMAIIAPNIDKLSILWATLSLAQLLQVIGFVLITIGVLIVVFIYSRFNRSHLLTNVTRYELFFNKYPKKGWRSLQLRIERNKTITVRSARKFYEITSIFLVRGHIEEVVEIFHANLKPLVYAARQYYPEHYRVNVNTKEPAKEMGSNYAFEMMLQLLTDEAVMRHICTANRPFLHAIVWTEIQANGSLMNNEFANILYPNILEHLLRNADSFLYSQKDTYNGSARFANIYKLLTNDKIIRRQNITPGQLTWQISKTSVPLDAYVEVLAGILERMIDSYKKEPNQIVLENIRSIIDQVMGRDGVTGRIVYDEKARERYANDISNSVEANVLRTIEIRIVHNLFRSDDPVTFTQNKDELNAKNEENRYDQKTLVGIMAHRVYEVIEQMTVLYHSAPDRDESVRRSLYDYIHVYSNTPLAKRFEELVYERMFDKAIYSKLEIASNIKGYYPNILRALIDSLTPFVLSTDEVKMDAQAKIKSIMANELKEALLEGRRMNNDELMLDVLLPDSVKAVVNSKKKTVTYYYVNRNGKKQRLNLDS